MEDADLLLRWRNDPEIVSAGASGRTVTPAEHGAWIKRVIGEGRGLLFLVHRDAEPIGQVRFELNAENVPVVSIYLLSGQRRQGAGHEALLLACQQAFAHYGAGRIEAQILRANGASRKFFEAAGFSLSGESGKELIFWLSRPPHVPHNRVTAGSEEPEAVAQVARSGQWSSGPRVAELERRLADYTGKSHVVCVASGSAALRLALMATGVTAGDTVGIPAYSCVALPNAALALGAVPMPMDIRSADWNLDAGAEPVKRALAACRAAIAVNTFGARADGTDQTAWIEDASHGLFSAADRMQRSPATAIVASLYSTKLLAAGEGGMVATDSASLAGAVRDWRDYTDKSPHRLRTNDKMNELEAAIGLCQLARLPATIGRRKAIASRYQEKLRPWADATRGITLPHWTDDRIWYRYVIRTQDPGTASALLEGLHRLGVQAERPVEDWRGDHKDGCVVSTAAYAQLISLPLYPGLTTEEHELVVRAVVNTLQSLP